MLPSPCASALEYDGEEVGEGASDEQVKAYLDAEVSSHIHTPKKYFSRHFKKLFEKKIF